MSRHRRADCCEYREERRRLASERLRNTAKGTTSKREMLDGCEENEGEPKNRKCEKEKSDKPKKPSKHDSFVDEMLSRIKPSIQNREKYLSDARHVRCFLEADEMEQLKRDERILRVYGREPCEAAQDSRATRRKKHIEPLERKMAAREDARGSNDVATDSQGTKEKKTKVKRRGEKDEFWCPQSKMERKKTESDLREESRQWEIDCKDSICSFDSQINLSGLALTKEDERTIRENRRDKVHAPATQ